MSSQQKGESVGLVLPLHLRHEPGIWESFDVRTDGTHVVFRSPRRRRIGATTNFEEAQKLKLRCSIMEMIDVQVVA